MGDVDSRGEGRSRPHGAEVHGVTDIDFGVFVAAVVDEIECVESDLTGEERGDAKKAAEHYKRCLVVRIRGLFDETEVRDQASPPACPGRGTPHPAGMKFCSECRSPLSREVRASLRDLLDEIEQEVPGVLERLYKLLA